MINHKISRLLKKLKNEKIQNDFQELSNLNQSDSKHWQLLNDLENKKKHTEKVVTLCVNGSTIVNGTEIVETFAENLANIFSIINNKTHEQTNIPSTNFFGPDEYVSTKELLDAIKNIKNKKSSGFDGISNKVIKNLPFNTLKSIHILFNYSIKLAHIPTKWKKAKVIMILKRGKPPDDQILVPTNLTTILSR